MYPSLALPFYSKSWSFFSLLEWSWPERDIKRRFLSEETKRLQLPTITIRSLRSLTATLIVTVSLWSIHTISHFDFGPDWPAGWLAGYKWQPRSQCYPRVKAMSMTISDVKTVEVLKYWIHTATDWYTESSKWYTKSSEEKARVLVRLSWSWNCHCKSQTDKYKSS